MATQRGSVQQTAGATSFSSASGQRIAERGTGTAGGAGAVGVTAGGFGRISIANIGNLALAAEQTDSSRQNVQDAMITAPVIGVEFGGSRAGTAEAPKANTVFNSQTDRAAHNAFKVPSFYKSSGSLGGKMLGKKSSASRATAQTASQKPRRKNTIVIPSRVYAETPGVREARDSHTQVEGDAYFASQPDSGMPHGLTRVQSAGLLQMAEPPTAVTYLTAAGTLNLVREVPRSLKGFKGS